MHGTCMSAFVGASPPCFLQILMLKRGRHALDLGTAEPGVACDVPPLGNRRPHLFSYGARLGRLQPAIVRMGESKVDGGGGIVRIDRGGHDARSDVERHWVEVVCG